MSDPLSPWSRPESGAVPVTPPSAAPAPGGPVGAPLRGGAGPAPRSGAGAAAPGTEQIELGPGWDRTGTVTLLGRSAPGPDVLDFGPRREPRAQRALMFRWFVGAAGAIVVIGVVVLLALVMTGHSPLHHQAPGPAEALPPLAKACPPPSVNAADLPPAPPAPPGPRTVDTQSGISYAAQGTPWVAWNEVWSAGDLKVRYGVGQHFVTETYSDGYGLTQDYHASILSGSVPAAANDALTLDLKCTGHQVLADVRLSYYPQPTTIEMFRDEVTTLGGRPAWVAKFRLHFHQQNLKATNELVGLALIDVGRPNAAILYISIPGTVTQYDPVVDQVLDSVRPT